MAKPVVGMSAPRLRHYAHAPVSNFCCRVIRSTGRREIQIKIAEFSNIAFPSGLVAIRAIIIEQGGTYRYS